MLSTFLKSKLLQRILLVLIITGFAYAVREYALQNLVADYDEPDYTNLSLIYARWLRGFHLKTLQGLTRILSIPHW